MKRLLCIFSAVILLLCCGCGEQTQKNPDSGSTAKPKDADISLAYNSADYFNPYTAHSEVNRLLGSLLYDSLIEIDGSYELQKHLAANIRVLDNTCTVDMIKTVFSDGSPVTAADVIYSFNAAKASSGRYSGALAGILTAEAIGEYTVKFTAAKKDIYMANLLGFPIFKAGSDNIRNEDNVILPPIGSGRYKLDEAMENLLANDSWYGGKPKIRKIRLINAPGEEALSHVIDIGAIDAYYTDLDDCHILRMSGKRQNINLNNLVFIGVNLSDALLSDVNLRQAISAALSRKKICEDAYFTNALPATGVFSPVWKAVSSMQTIDSSQNLNITIENLNKIGYNRKDAEGYCVNQAGKRLSFSLLVNSENQFRSGAADMIAAQLKAAGIEVRVEKVSYDSYLSRLSSGKFQLYLAETNILDNMDVSNIICPSGSVAYGIRAVGEEAENAEQLSGAQTSVKNIKNAVEGFYSGQGTAADIAAIAISEMPVIPIAFRTGILFSSEDIPAEGAYENGIYAAIK